MIGNKNVLPSRINMRSKYDSDAHKMLSHEAVKCVIFRTKHVIFKGCLYMVFNHCKA